MNMIFGDGSRTRNSTENPAGVFLPFEESIDPNNYVYNWLKTNWQHSFYFSAGYLLLTLLGERIMRNRPRFDLQRPLFIWNSALAIFSCICVLRGIPYAIDDIFNIGFVGAVCDCSRCVNNKVLAFWAYVFAMSKVIELGDTVFVILRKQPLLFLHIFHHCTVLIYSWYSYSTQPASAKMFCLANSCVHAVMYSYFAMKTIKLKIPKLISMMITAGQIFQMIVGCFTNFVVFLMLTRGEECDVTLDNIKYSVIMYFSYLVLFTHFFIRSYITGVPLSSYWKNSRDVPAKKID